MPRSKIPSGRPELQAFASALFDALRAKEITQGQLAAELDTSQSMISTWINGIYEMPRDLLFQTEKLLAVPPGYLSRHLGYRPLDESAERPASAQEAILLDPLLDDAGRHTLLALYRHLIEQPASEPKAEARAKARSSRPGAASNGRAKRPAVSR